MWKELVNGKPELDDTLGVDARMMKAEAYEKMFKSSTTRDHMCRVPGVSYLRCLSDNVRSSQADRCSACLAAFSSFESCRAACLRQQATAMQSSLASQDLADSRAKAMFERRNVLLDFVRGPADS
eukprot:GHVS01043781.1.p1 GENE.GHVS01043781.1~~GHVS01043781.1.p1  ORF type:complete len:125 (+),score=18.38 GHVS01043781.1:161-535(+)